MIDCPSGPSTIHTVGTIRAGPASPRASRRQISGMSAAEAISESANIA